MVGEIIQSDLWSYLVADTVWIKLLDIDGGKSKRAILIQNAEIHSRYFSNIYMYCKKY